MRYQREMTAFYNPDVAKDHKGSPFLEALPSMMDIVDLGRRLSSLPRVPDEWRQGDRLFRTQKVASLCDQLCFVSLPRHVDAATKFQTTLYQGYTFRGNLDWPQAKAERDAEEAAWERGAASATDEITLGGAFLGPSGAGKTTTLKRCCSLFPQIVHHGEYGGCHFTKTQIVYLWVQCPEDSSEKGLLICFFAELDRLLGTNDSKIYSAKKTTLNEMMAGVARRCHQNAIGVIILDEIEALLKFSPDPSKTAQFLTRLSNMAKAPIIKLGLPDASHLLGADMYQARRSIGFTPWEMLHKGWEWDTFTSQLFSLYLLKSDPDLKEIGRVLFSITLGNPAIAVSVFKHAQLACLMMGEELLTPKRLATVMGREAKILEDAFRLLSSGKVGQTKKQPRKAERLEPDPTGELLAPPPIPDSNEDDGFSAGLAA